MEIVFESEYIKISKEGNDYFIQSLQQGMSVNSFNQILVKYPDIKITDFMSIKNVILCKEMGPIKFGECQPRITFETSADNLKIYLTLHVSDIELETPYVNRLLTEIKDSLKQMGITYGIILDDVASRNLLCNGKQILIAEALKPQNGEDSFVKRFVFHDSKPKINEGQKVDFYEIDLINRIKENEYLAEWSASTKGVPGINLKGEEIAPTLGKNTPIPYDKTSIYEETVDNVTKLFSMKDGAVEFKNGILSVKNNLELDNVDFKTGNIDFDGYVTIKGVIEDSFSVKATKDIEILSSQGLGCVKSIESTQGNIFIRGGINGRGRTTIIAKKNVFAKFVNESIISCEQMVNIGSYAFNSTINANSVVVESSSGQIMGGKTVAISKISCANIGAISERFTHIVLMGINRTELTFRAEKLIKFIENLRIELSKLEKDLASYSGISKATVDDIKKLNLIKTKLIVERRNLKDMEEEKKQIQETLKTKGNCELVFSKNVYPNTTIQMKSNSLKVTEALSSGSLYLEECEIKKL